MQRIVFNILYFGIIKEIRGKKGTKTRYGD